MIFLVILDLKSSFPFFFLTSKFYLPINWFFPYRYEFFFFCHRLIATCFVATDSWVVMSSTVNFFLGFRIGSSHDKV